MAAAPDPEPEPEPAGTTASAPADGEVVDADVVLRLEIEPGHTVTFHEPSPGSLYLVERMASNQAFVLGDKEASDALFAFARLRPGAHVPAALQAAYDRARNLPGDANTDEPAFGSGPSEPSPAHGPAPSSGVIEQGLTSSSSAATFVNSNGGCDWGPQGSFCRVNWGNGFWAYHTAATSGLCIVDHYAGNGLIVQITVGSTISSFYLGAGTIAQYSLGAAGSSKLRRLDITNATGDSFHVGCRWGV